MRPIGCRNSELSLSLFTVGSVGYRTIGQSTQTAYPVGRGGTMPGTYKEIGADKIGSL